MEGPFPSFVLSKMKQKSALKMFSENNKNLHSAFLLYLENASLLDFSKNLQIY